MLLAIDTAGAACSVALINENGSIEDERHERVGRGHAEHLMPMIRDMMGAHKPSTIAVDCGPGSFTGLRVGIAAARGLGLGWAVPVTGFSSTALLAAAGFAQYPNQETLMVALQGGHGQVFVEVFKQSPFQITTELQSLLPQDAAQIAIKHRLLLGSGAAMVAEHMPMVTPDQAVDISAMDMRAADVRLLDVAWRTREPVPIYGRAPDAKPNAA